MILLCRAARSTSRATFGSRRPRWSPSCTSTCHWQQRPAERRVRRLSVCWARRSMETRSNRQPTSHSWCVRSARCCSRSPRRSTRLFARMQSSRWSRFCSFAGHPIRNKSRYLWESHLFLSYTWRLNFSYFVKYSNYQNILIVYLKLWSCANTMVIF